MGGYTPMVPIALWGCIPAVLFLLSRLGTRRGLIAAFVLGWLLLPVAGYKVQGLPPWTKQTAVSVSALIALLAYDPGGFAKLRPAWFDIPMFFWCLSPSLSSLVNGLGINEALLNFVDQIVTWVLPYLIGRIYFVNASGMRELAIGIVLGGVLYVPLCLYEIRMSPQLHDTVYGFHQHQFLQSIRMGGYRPTVFLQHGLAVGLYMCSAALAAFWLWRRKSVKVVLRMPMAWVSWGLLIVSVWVKSAGSLALLAAGYVAMWTPKSWRSRIPLLVLLLLAPLYMSVRAPALWKGQELIDIAYMIDDDRGGSLEFRLQAEDKLAARALEQPLLGWAGWGRNLMVEGYEEKDVTSDGMWVLILGKHGIFGLAMWTFSLLLPVLLFLFRTPTKLLFEPEQAAAMALSYLVVFFVIDSLFNAMPNPMYVLAAGGLAGYVATTPRPRLFPRMAAAARRSKPSGLASLETKPDKTSESKRP